MRRLLLLGLALAGCARYEPAPLAPERHAEAWSRRTLDGDSAWGIPALAQAAWRARPELEAARRRWIAVRAAEVSAGRRPQPGLIAGTEYGRDPGPFEEPWTIGIGVILRFELGGQRGARIAAAEARTLEAELAARALAMELASDVRDAALAVLVADSAAVAAEGRLAATVARAEQAERLYAAGTLGRTALEGATTARRLADRDLAVARAAGVRARAGLAERVGVPVAATTALRIDGGELVGCGWTARLDAPALRAVALRRRYELGRALAAYAVTEGELRMAVAEQYPDLEFSPGYAWDQGLSRWLASLALPVLLLDRNRGPIGEATAWRAQRAAEVEVAQQAVLAQVETALAECRAADAERESAAALVSAASELDRVARAAFDRGETGRGDLLAATVLVADASAARAAAEAGVALAGARLERATGLWTADTAYALPDPLAAPDSTLAGAMP